MKAILISIVLLLLLTGEISPADYDRWTDNKLHGAELIVEKWDGTITAYKWDNGKYEVMWRAKRR